MSMSIYYTARRDVGLTEAERQEIARLNAKFSVAKRIEERERTRKGPNWEEFCIYDPAQPTAPDVVFEGSTKLPGNGMQHCWTGMKHWCELLSEIRQQLPGAEWAVSVDDHEIPWDEDLQQFDPSR